MKLITDFWVGLGGINSGTILCCNILRKIVQLSYRFKPPYPYQTLYQPPNQTLYQPLYQPKPLVHQYNVSKRKPVGKLNC